MRTSTIASLLACATLSTGALALRNASGPDYALYVARPMIAATDTTLLTSVAIKRAQTRDYAPRLSYRSLDTLVATAKLATTHTAVLTAKRRGLARIEGTYWVDQNKQGVWRKLYDTVVVTVVTPPPPPIIAAGMVPVEGGCLTAAAGGLAPCDPADPQQRWRLERNGQPVTDSLPLATSLCVTQRDTTLTLATCAVTVQ